MADRLNHYRAHLYDRAKRSLRDAFLQANGGDAVGTWGKRYDAYASNVETNLLDGVPFADLRKAYADGKGQELRGDDRHPPKMAAIYSSSALVINTFGPWYQDPSHLLVNGHRGFKTMTFEAQVPHGLKSTPPHLDLRLDAEDRVLAIESKCLEYLRPKKAKFASAYDTIVDQRAQSSWFRHIAVLRENSERYQYLDAAQLIKHYLGLSHSDPTKSLTLLYLFWEPRNWREFDAFQQHHMEIREFSDVVAGDRVRFEALSYTELWAEWKRVQAPAWLAAHLERLKARYSIEIFRPNWADRKGQRPIRISSWSEGVVDLEQEHIKLFVGTWSDNRLIALLAPAGEHSFTVQFVVDKIADAAAVADVIKDLNYILVKLHEVNPWLYAKHYTNSISEVYGTVHWGLYEPSAS